MAGELLEHAKNNEMAEEIAKSHGMQEMSKQFMSQGAEIYHEHGALRS